MAVIKEYREFLLRSTKVSGGTKPDQETNFPIEYTVNGKLVKNRFLKEHIPSENVFKKFLESITFKLNDEDKATAIMQGLVKLATDAEVVTNAQDGSTPLSKTVQPHQMIQVAVIGTEELVFTGDLTNTSPTISNITDTSDLVVGDSITGTGIPTSTTIIAVGVSTVTMSANATATNAGVSIIRITDTTLSLQTTVEHGGLKIKRFRKTVSSLYRNFYKLSVNVANSISINGATKKIELVNDVSSPGNNQRYGTTAVGVKGWVPNNGIVLAAVIDGDATTPVYTNTNSPIINITGLTFALARTGTGVYTITASGSTPFSESTCVVNINNQGTNSIIFNFVFTSSTVITLTCKEWDGATFAATDDVKAHLIITKVS